MISTFNIVQIIKQVNNQTIHYKNYKIICKGKMKISMNLNLEIKNYIDKIKYIMRRKGSFQIK